MMNKTNCSEQTGWQAVKCIWEKYSALWLVPAFILGITLGFAIGYSVTNQYAFVESMIPEIVGIGISITGIYYLEQWRQGRVEDARLKEELLWQAKSQSNETAKSAIDRIRYKGWLTGEDGLLKGATLGNANLTGVFLNDACLTDAYLENAFLDNAQLIYCYLRGANLQSSHLNYSDLRGACLEGVSLSFARFIGSNLLSADLNNAWMRGTDFTGAILMGTNLEGSLLSGANFTGAYLQDAKVSNEDFERTLHGESLVSILPDGTQWTPSVDIARFTNPQHDDFHETLQTIHTIRRQRGFMTLD